MNVKYLLGFILVLLLGAGLAQAGMFPLSDLEGSDDNLRALIDQGVLREVGGELEFVRADSTLLFGGDLVDRGPHSIRLTRLMTRLKERYPDRVTLLWGNRDINKLTILPDVRALAASPSQEYQEWLVSRLRAEGVTIPESPDQLRSLIAAQNNTANRVDFWLASHSAGEGLENHRLELERTSGRSVTRAQAADDYLRFMGPDGEFQRYMGLGQIASGQEGVFSVHGGVTTENMGRVPGDPTVYRDPNEWIRRLNAWGREQLERYRAAGRAGTPVTNPSTYQLVAYGDAIWDPHAIDPHTGRAGAVIMNDQSVIYPFRYKEGGNIRLYSPEVGEFLQRGGYSIQLLHHTPSGNASQVLKDRARGFLTLMNDTSFGTHGHLKVVEITGGEINYRGALGGGEMLNYRVTATSDDFIGTVLSDGRTVVGRSADGRYAVFNYYQGHKISESFMTTEEVRALNPRPPYVGVEGDQERLRQVRLLRDNLEGRVPPVDILDPDDLDDLVANRQVFLESGASRYGQWPTDEAGMRRAIAEFYDGFDANRIVIVTGGTDHGVEKLVHEYALRRGIPVVGFIQEGTPPSDIGMVRRVVIAGRVGNWDDPLRAAINFVQRHAGQMFFRGGGGVVTTGIEEARRIGASYHLQAFDGVVDDVRVGTMPNPEGEHLPPVRNMERAGGASGIAARERPWRMFVDGRSLSRNVMSPFFRCGSLILEAGP